jgi:hypothetical protein
MNTSFVSVFRSFSLATDQTAEGASEDPPDDAATATSAA